MPNRYTVLPAAKAAFEALVERVNDSQPHTGWNHTRQLPTLTMADYATVLRANPDALDDVVIEPQALADMIEVGPEAAKEYLAFNYFGALQPYLREVLLHALQDYCDDPDMAMDVLLESPL